MKSRNLLSINVLWIAMLCLALLSCQSPLPSQHACAALPPPHVTVKAMNGVVYVGSPERLGGIVALSGHDGSQLWQQKKVASDSSNFTIDQGVIYVGSSVLTAIKDGKKLWEFDGGWTDRPSQPVVKDGVVYYAAGKGVFALRASDGKQIWSNPDGTYLLGVSDGMVYTGTTSSNSVHAWRASDGKLVWSVLNSDELHLRVVTESRVYIASKGKIDVYQSSDGKHLWQASINGEIFSISNPSASNEVYVLSASEQGPGDTVDALEKQNGKLLWRFQHKGLQTLKVEGRHVYVTGDYGGEGTSGTYVLLAREGKLLWSKPVGSRAMLLKGGVLYLIERDGVAAWDALTGKQVWLSKVQDQATFYANAYNHLAAEEQGRLSLSQVQPDACGHWDVSVFAIDALDGKQIWRSTF